MEQEITSGNCYEIKIIDMGHKGEAIGKIGSLTVFVEGALKGDIVLAKIIQRKKNYAVAITEKILTPSNNRIYSPCEVSHLCGGCQIMEMDYQEQLLMKQHIVEENMKRIGGLDLIHVLPVIGMKHPYRYRNKGQYPVAIQNNTVVSGFYKVRSHDIVPVNDCILQQEISNTAVTIIRNFAQKKGISVYNETSHQGNLRRIVVKVGFETKQVMIVLVTKERKFPHRKELLTELQQQIPNLTTIVQNIQPKPSNTVMGKENIVWFGDGTIYDTLNGLTFEISPLSFYQVNPIQTEVLYNTALKLANLSGRETVIDLYCGIGTISLFLSRNAKKVYGVEIVEDAILDAKKNASHNQIDNVEFICGKSEDVLPQLYKKGICADIVMLDPPRKGCDETLLHVISEMNVPRIVYISCNSATLARDMKLLHELGYTADTVQPVDMFCHTMHVETVALLSKLDVDKHIDVEIKLDELDLTSAESKATYAQIKKYILEKFDLKVSTLYIAQIKKKCGIVLREHYNKSKKEKQVIPQCTPEKEEAIMDALRHFKMI